MQRVIVVYGETAAVGRPACDDGHVTSDHPAEGSDDPLRGWDAVATAPAPITGDPVRTVMTVVGVLLVLFSVTLIGLEAWDHATGVSVQFPPSLVDRYGWPLFPAAWGVTILAVQYATRHSIDVC